MWRNYTPNSFDIAGNNDAKKTNKQIRKRSTSHQQASNYIFASGENNSGKLVKIQILDTTGNIEKLCVQVQYVPDSTQYCDEIYQSIENIVRKISTKISSNVFV